MPEQCVFCQLLDNPQQTLTIHETENFKAWLDINPRARGHTMVVPKDHKASAEEVGEELKEMFDVARIVGQKAINGLGADGYSIVANNGEAAGQKMGHFYMIVFPRFEDEESAGTPTGAIFRPKEDMEQEDLMNIQETMSSADFDDYSTYEKSRYEKEVKEKEKGEDRPDQRSGFRKNQRAEFR